MKKYIILIAWLIISIFELNATIYNNTYNVNGYEAPYSSTYNYIPFKSTSSNIQTINYNTVKSLNEDGTVSIEYTTYKGTYNPRRANRGLDLDDDDEYIGQYTPIGDPDVYIIALLFLLYILFKRHKENILNKNVG